MVVRPPDHVQGQAEDDDAVTGLVRCPPLHRLAATRHVGERLRARANALRISEKSEDPPSCSRVVARGNRSRARNARRRQRVWNHARRGIPLFRDPTRAPSENAAPNGIRFRRAGRSARRAFSDHAHHVEFLQVHAIDLTCKCLERQIARDRSQGKRCVAASILVIDSPRAYAMIALRVKDSPNLNR